MIYLFYGEDTFSITEEVKRIKTDNLPPDAQDFNFVKLDALKSGFVIDEVFNTADAFPFLSDKRVVVVSGLLSKLGKSAAAEERAAAKAKGRGAAATKAQPTTPRERFLDFIPRVPSTTVLVLTEEKVTKTDAIYKALDKHGAVREFEAPKDWALEKWINERAVKENIKLERNVAPLLREYAGSDLYRLYNELQKLGAYAGEGKAVTTGMVEMLTATVPETKVWDLTDALAQRDLRKALRQLNLMRQESTQTRTAFNRQVFNMISKQIYDLLRVKELYGARKSAREIAEATGMHPFRIEKTLPLLRNFQGERLSELYSRLTELDYADKTGKADLATQLDILVAEICQR